MGHLKTYFLLFLAITSVKSEKSLEAVKTIIQNYQGSISIHPCLCWKIEDITSFFRMFCSDKNVFCAFHGDIPDYETISHQIIVFDFECNETMHFLRHFNMKDRQYMKWIFMNVHPHTHEFMRLFEGQDVGLGTEVYILSKDGEEINQVYKRTFNSSITVERYGKFSNGTFLDERTDILPIRRRQNLHGALLRFTIVILHNASMNHLDDYRERELDGISKIPLALSKHLISLLNATQSVIFTNSWGYYDPKTKKWQGMIQHMLDNEADIPLTPFLVVIDRMNVINYIGLTSLTGINMVFQSPKLSYTDDIFILPFTKMVWFCYVIFGVGIGVLLFTATYVEWKIKDHDIEDPAILKPTIIDGLHLVFSAACQQGTPATPRSFSAKAIMFLCFLSLMFLFTSYSANIVALLQAPSNKIRTLEDLYNSRIEIAIQDTVYNRYFASRQTERVRQLIYEKRILKKDGTKNFIAMKDGIARIRKGLFAFYFEGSGYKVMLDTFEEHEKCGLQEMQYFHASVPYASIKANSTYKDMIKVGWQRLNENGIAKRENNRIYSNKPKCPGNVASFVPVSIVDVAPAFILLCWGFGIAVSMVIAEILVKKFRKN